MSASDAMQEMRSLCEVNQ